MAPPSPRVNGVATHTDFRAEHSHLRATAKMVHSSSSPLKNLVFAAAWQAAGHAELPTFHGVPCDTMVDNLSAWRLTKRTCSSRTLTVTSGFVDNPNGSSRRSTCRDLREPLGRSGARTTFDADESAETFSKISKTLRPLRLCVKRRGHQRVCQVDIAILMVAVAEQQLMASHGQTREYRGRLKAKNDVCKTIRGRAH